MAQKTRLHNRITIGNIMTPNPWLWLDTGSLGTDTYNYVVATDAPGEEWFQVNQFCALLTPRWLLSWNANNPPMEPFGIQLYPAHEQVAMAEELINLHGQDADIAYLVRQLRGGQLSLAETAAGVEGQGQKKYRRYTRIAATNGRHIIGIYLLDDELFSYYDPDTADVLMCPRAEFRQLMEALQCTVFVVAEA